MDKAFEKRDVDTNVRYEIVISDEEARLGTRKILLRQDKRLEVNIPPGVKTGSIVKLTDALRLTNGYSGDILISMKIKEEKISTGVIEINDKNFGDEVLKYSSPVLVDFWAPWCGPCRLIAPVTEKLAEEYAGRLKFCKLNVDDNPQMASRYQVMSIPKLLFFRDGQVVDEIIGAVPESALRSKVESVLR